VAALLTVILDESMQIGALPVHRGLGAADRNLVAELVAPDGLETDRLQHADAVDDLYEDIYCARGEAENRIKECQLDLFADRTSAATMKANQLRLWFASMAYVLLTALRRLGLRHTQFAEATCGTIRLRLLKIGALVRLSCRRIKLAMASAFPCQPEYALAHLRLTPERRCRSAF
jgi:Transposase DDE domain group 1